MRHVATRTLNDKRPIMNTCDECGAPVSEGSTCRDNFHALLLLEADVPGAAGGVPHFYAVACYSLQHPRGMNLTPEAHEGLRAAVADVLNGRATLDDIRCRVRRAANGPQRVTRRNDDAAVTPSRRARKMTVTDVCAGGVEGYHERVERWARSIVATLATI